LRIKLLPWLFIATVFTACKHDKLEVDTSKIALNLHIDRFEGDLFAADTLNPKESFARLGKKYPDFLPLFTTNISNLRSNTDSSLEKGLMRFVGVKDLRALKKDVDSVYPTLDAQRLVLENALKHYKYYYPNARIPRVITFLSGFNNAIVNTDADLGIGLDMFLGSGYKYYASVNFPRYLARTLNKDHLVQTAIKGFAKQVFPALPSSSTLLANMIYEGKILYFVDAMMPGFSDTAKIGYSSKQLEWCRANESRIWAYSVEEDKLFSSDRKYLENFFADGPFTTGLNQESPPRLGMYVGWQIVRKYMGENQEVSLQELMNQSDARKILDASGYKP